MYEKDHGGFGGGVFFMECNGRFQHRRRQGSDKKYRRQIQGKSEKENPFGRLVVFQKGLAGAQGDRAALLLLFAQRSRQLLCRRIDFINSFFIHYLVLTTRIKFDHLLEL